jgi:GTP-binding protein EngB required for normal cell division
MIEAAALSHRSILDGERWRRLGELLSRSDLLILPGSVRLERRREWEEIDTRERNLDDRLSVGLIGGTGVGKSTLINALAGEEISRSGARRPTTDRVLLYRHRRTPLAAELPRDGLAEPQVLHENAVLERIIILDFPDFDSVEASHHEILLSYLPHLDILLVLVDDVKYGDRALFELLSSLPQSQENLFAALNKIDRLERRYGERWREVAEEILDDLRDKLAAHGGLRLERGQMAAISALAAFENRCRPGAPPRKSGEMERIESLLESYRDLKRRKAAKELNLEARKQALASLLAGEALGGHLDALGESASRFIESRAAELEDVLKAIPQDLLLEPERRSLCASRLERVGPGWGFPVAFIIGILCQLRFRRGGRVLAGEGLGRRVEQRYAAYLEAAANFERAFAVEFGGSALQRETAPAAWRAAEARGERGNDLGAFFQRELARGEESLPAPRRWHAHIMALAVVAFGVWSLFHPILAAVAARDGSWTDVGAAVVRAALGALSPAFLAFMALAVAVAYLLAAFYLWARQGQYQEQVLLAAERAVREEVRKRAGNLLRAKEDRAGALRAELSELAAILGPQGAPRP